MARITATDVNGKRTEVDEGEACVVYGTISNPAETFNKAVIQTLTLTLLNASDGAVINSRNGTDILDDGAVGTLSTAGLVTVRLNASDNAIVSSTLTADQTESHYALIEWTYTDTLGNTQTGKQEIEILVRKLTAVAA